MPKGGGPETANPDVGPGFRDNHILGPAGLLCHKRGLCEGFCPCLQGLGTLSVKPQRQSRSLPHKPRGVCSSQMLLPGTSLPLAVERTVIPELKAHSPCREGCDLSHKHKPLGKNMPQRLAMDSDLDAFSRYPSLGSLVTAGSRLITETREVV